MKKIIYLLTFIFIIFCIGICVTYFYVPTKTKLYGFSYNTNTTELDFTEVTITKFDVLVEKMKTFDNLQRVKFKDDTLTVYQKETLKKLYPDVDFITISYVNLYDQILREDVKEIDLSNSIIDSGIIEKLQDFNELETVKLYNSSLNLDDKVELINRYPNITFEMEVDVNGTEYPYDIKELDLTKAYITDKISFIKTLKLFPYLKTLDMSNTNFTDEELGNLRDMYTDIQIDWIVHLKRWNIKTNATSFSVLIRQFDYDPIVSEDLYVLKYCTKLEALDLGHQKITDISMIPEYLPNLKVLILADNKIKDISSLSKLKKLHYLELFVNQITDITPLKECKELIDINLCYNNNLTDISTLYELPYLERIWLVNVPAREQIDILQEKLPNANIVRYGPGSTEDGWRTHERYYAMIKMYRNPTWPVNEVFTKYDGISKNH